MQVRACVRCCRGLAVAVFCLTMAVAAAAEEAQPAAATAAEILAAGRAAMARRNLPLARRLIQAGSAAAQSDAERAEADRVQTLLDSLVEFWKAVANEIGRLQVAEEIQLAGTQVSVVQPDPRELILRIEGKNMTFTAARIPGTIAVALAERQARASDPVANLHIGSFYAIDLMGDKEKARARWQKAGKIGQSLLPELELDPAAQAAAAARGGTPQKRLPPPDADELLKLRRELRDATPAARDARGRYEAVRKVFDAAEALEGEPGKRYALYDRARAMAVTIGDPDLFITVIDAIAYHYQVDAVAMKVEALAAAWKSRDALAFRDSLLKVTLELYEAQGEGRSEAKTKLQNMLLVAARATRNLELLQRIEADRKR